MFACPREVESTRIPGEIMAASRSTNARRRFLQAAAGSILLPVYPGFAGFARAQASRTLSVEKRTPEEQARADATLNTSARHALVIGNSRYAGVTPLKNPANDASAIAEQLRPCGFQVVLKQDLTREAMLDAISTYAARIAATKSVGLFYFAGHGVQLSWRNFLVPVDAVINNLEDIPGRCVDLGTLVSGITKANNPMNVVVLDACRNNPFGDVKLEAKGLSQLDAPLGTLLAFATSPGNVASDGDGANGLYTENLLRELKIPETKIEDVFKRVRLGVRRHSNGQQIPWESTSLEEDFYFLPPKQIRPVTESEADRQFEVELALWEKIRTSTQPAPLEEFLRRYPSGRFSELAQLQLDRVLKAQGEKRIKIESTGPTPLSQGTGIADSAFKVGDSYSYRELDLLTGVEQRRLTESVTRVTDFEVHYDNRKITDLLGNPVRSRDGQQNTSQQNFPTEYRVGKRWSSRNRFSYDNGSSGDSAFEFLVVAREPITVAAGTFNAFRIEGRGSFSGTNPRVGNIYGQADLKFWMEPDKVRVPIIFEDLRKIGNRYRATSRFELVSFKQS